MKKNDFILIGCMILIAFAASVFWFFIETDEDAKVVVTVEGKSYGSYLLKEDTQINIKGTNILRIKDGQADMIDADCPDKLCVHQKPISKAGESIICLPHKIIVTIENNDTQKIDAISD